MPWKCHLNPKIQPKGFILNMKFNRKGHTPLAKTNLETMPLPLRDPHFSPDTQRSQKTPSELKCVDLTTQYGLLSRMNRGVVGEVLLDPCRRMQDFRQKNFFKSCPPPAPARRGGAQAHNPSYRESRERRMKEVEATRRPCSKVRAK